MAITHGPKLGLLYNSNIQEYYADDFRILLQSLDAIVQASVITNTYVVPPTSPNPGDAYLLPQSPAPSGAWSGQAGKIAVWDAQLTNSGTNTVVPGWIFFTPKPGWVVYITSLSSLYYYNGGTWGPVTNNAIVDVTSYADQVGSGTVSPVANSVRVWSLNLLDQVVFENFGYDVATPDSSGSNFYSLGIYSYSGTLLASTGAVAGSSFAPSAGFQTSPSVGSTVLQPGNYYLALTGTATTAVLRTAPSQFLGTSNFNAGSSAGGALPATVSAPVTAWAIDTTRPAIALF